MIPRGTTRFQLGQAGGVATVLPPLLIGPKFGLSPTEMAGLFTVVALANVGLSGPLALAADRYGKERLLALGTGLSGLSFAGLSFAGWQATSAGTAGGF